MEQRRFFDSATYTESRRDMYFRLARLAEEKVGIPAAEVMKYLEFETVDEIGSAEGRNLKNLVRVRVV